MKFWHWYCVAKRFFAFAVLVVCVNEVIPSGLLAQIKTSESIVAFSYHIKSIENDHHVTIDVEATTPKHKRLMIFRSAYSDEIGGQITFDENVISSLDINTDASNIEKITVDGSDVVVYKKAKPLIEIKLNLKKSIGDIPAIIPLEMVSFYVEKGKIQNAISQIHISKQAILEAQTKVATSGLNSLSLWAIFFISFASGFLALLTPCIYAMLPLTVSFFIKKKKSRKQSILNSLIYSCSIIIIFTLLGVVLTALLGPTVLNFIATNSIINIFFFLVFVIFAISFFGVFEITLPASWSTGTSKLSGKTDFGGIFFMALTLVIVSFSCTGPIIGNLIVVVSQGSLIAPILGFFGFSLSLSIPFFVFALFPGLLGKLSKSGSWLNTIKVVLGFLELALALKFLSNADLALGTRWLDREVFLSLWIALFVLLTFYLLGFIRFNNDQELDKNSFGVSYISVSRVLSSLVSLAFAVYLIPGLWGAPLNAVSAFLPPMGTQDFKVGTSSMKAIDNNDALAEGKKRKYADEMEHLEPAVVKQYGLQTYFDYDEALAVAKEVHKPLMLDFTGVNCANCRKMESQVWSNPSVMQLLRDSFVIASLYVDVRNVLLKTEDIYTSKQGEKFITIGDKYAHFQIDNFNSNVQPYYFFIDNEGNRLIAEGYGYDSNTEAFLAHLQQALYKFHKVYD